ncbi:MAG: ATP-binding protein [Victivallales bacterium]|nr:ATP-binding protein [Victivallales bacterium]
MKRKTDGFLREWRQSEERLPLIVRGARQVGKTETIRSFAKENYRRFLEVNFVEEPKFKTIIEEGYSASSIVKLMSKVTPQFRFEAGHTLIFFDEVQEFPDITTSLKFFKQDGRFDVICSGSLLGIQYKRIASQSVGYKTDYLMRSFDFEEYLWALGYQEDIADEIFEQMQSLKPFTPGELKLFSNLFMDYILLGGMPAVLRDYVTRHTFERTLDIQRQILQDYQADIRKYAESLDKTKIQAVFNQIAPQLAKENKKFQYSKIAPGARSREYFGCVEWLLDAGVASICHCLNFPELPLKGNADMQKFKLYVPDTGLLVAMLDDEAGDDLRINNNLGVYKGAIYENIVAEALSKSGYDLYYYRREDGSLEQDFFVRTASELLPIEVKGGNSISKSLRNLIASDHYPDIRHGIKFINGNLGQTETITTFPYFCAFLLRRFLKNSSN